MRLRGWKRHLAFGLLIGGVTFVAACNVGIGAGFGGGIVTLLLLTLFAGGTSATQSACYLQPCLSPRGTLDDVQAGDTSDGSKGVKRDTTPEDTLRACLSLLPPDTGFDGGATDADVDAMQKDAPDSNVDPTDASGTDGSDDAADDGGEAVDAVWRRDAERREILDRLEDRLPDDVVARLSDDEESA